MSSIESYRAALPTLTAIGDEFVKLGAVFCEAWRGGMVDEGREWRGVVLPQVWSAWSKAIVSDDKQARWYSRVD
jgi:hypothetical protein